MIHLAPGHVDVDDVDLTHAQSPTMMHFWTVSSTAGAAGNALLGADTCRCKTGADLYAADVSGSDDATNKCALRFMSQGPDRQRDREDGGRTACCLLDEGVQVDDRQRLQRSFWCTLRAIDVWQASVFVLMIGAELNVVPGHVADPLLTHIVCAVTTVRRQRRHRRQ